MPENLSDTLLTLSIVAGCAAAWGASIGAVFWDLRRARTPDGELAAWTALVALVPGAGALAYLTWRLLGLFLSPQDLSRQPSTWKKRITSVLRPGGLPPRKSTIPAADLLRPTLPELGTPPASGAVPGAGRFALQVSAGPHAETRFALDPLPATIGRGEGSVVRLDDDLGVSRHHAEIYLQADTLRIRDLSSTHGTHVNGFSISDKSLEPGDRIRVGMTEMTLEQGRKEVENGG